MYITQTLICLDIKLMGNSIFIFVDGCLDFIYKKSGATDMNKNIYL